VVQWTALHLGVYLSDVGAYDYLCHAYRHNSDLNIARLHVESAKAMCLGFILLHYFQMIVLSHPNAENCTNKKHYCQRNK